jgi:hypothetical protein
MTNEDLYNDILAQTQKEIEDSNYKATFEPIKFNIASYPLPVTPKVDIVGSNPKVNIFNGYYYIRTEAT